MPNKTYTVDQFGAQVRAKSPAAFQGMTDRDIAEKTLKARPDLASLVVETAQTVSDAKKGVTRRAVELGGGLLRAVVKPIGQQLIQFPRAIVSGAAGLASAAGAPGAANLKAAAMRPINVPFLGEVKALEATPGAQGATSREIAGQTLETAASVLPAGKTGWGAVSAGMKAGGLSGAGGALQMSEKPLRQVATEAAFGAAAGGLLGGVAPAIKSLKNTVSPSVREGLIKAIRPPKGNQTFAKDVDTVVQELAPKASEITSLQSLASAIRDKRKQVWTEVRNRLGTKMQAGDAIVDLSPAATRIEALAKHPVLNIQGGNAKERLLQTAQNVRSQKYSVEEAEEVLESLNAQMEAYYKKNNIGRAAAEKADPDVAANLAIMDEIRSGLDKKMSGFKDLKHRYGALSNVGDQVNRRIPVAEAANQFNLAEQISAGRTTANVLGGLVTGNWGQAASQMADFGVTAGLKELEKSDSKVAAAFSQVARSSGFLNRAAQALRPVGAALRPVGKALERGAIMKAGGLLSRPRTIVE